MNIREYQIRPVERAVASWPEGDGAGMCKGSSWPDVSVSAQVVDVSGRGARGSLGSGRSAGCAIGEGRTSPQWSRRGSAAAVSRAGSNALSWLPGPSTTRERPHAGFSPARGVINVPPPAPVRVCVCGLVSGVLWHILMSRGQISVLTSHVILEIPCYTPGQVTGQVTGQTSRGKS